MIRRLAILSVLVTGCGQREAPLRLPSVDAATSEPADAASPRPADAATAAPAGPFRPDHDPACQPGLVEIVSNLERSQEAMDPFGPYQEALRLWRATPPGCRGATWLLAAGELRPDVMTAEGVASASDAVTRALALEPDNPALLARLALLGEAVPGRYPALPADACERVTRRVAVAPKLPGYWSRAVRTAEASDGAYLCGLAALKAGDAARALIEFEKMADSGDRPDRLLRRAQALSALGRQDEARKAAKEAATEVEHHEARFDLTEDVKRAMLGWLRAIAR